MSRNIHNKPRISIPSIKARGRFRAIVHTGHEYNEDGSIKRHGLILRETPFGKNTITLEGFNAFMSGSNWNMWCVAGTGNTAPSESDNALANYVGKASTRVGNASVSVNANPADLPLYWRMELRHTFNPGSFGGSSVNIAEAGIVNHSADSSAAINGSTPVGARGLLQDESGNPTTVSVAPEEYLDLVWEYTEYLPYDATGVVSISIDGVPTNHNYTVRPCQLYLGGTQYGWFIPAAFNSIATNTIRFQGVGGPTAGDTVWGRGSGMTNGALGAPNTAPSSTYSGEKRPQTLGWRSYVTNSKQRIGDATWTLARGNAPAPGYSNVFMIACGHSNWQFTLDPPIQKIATKQFDLEFTLSIDNA